MSQNDQSPYHYPQSIPSPPLKPRHINDIKCESFRNNLLHWRVSKGNSCYVTLIESTQFLQINHHLLHELGWALPSNLCRLCQDFALALKTDIFALSLLQRCRFCPCPNFLHVLTSFFALALALKTDIFALSTVVLFLPLPPFPPCFAINVCPCPCPLSCHFMSWKYRGQGQG